MKIKVRKRALRDWSLRTLGRKSRTWIYAPVSLGASLCSVKPDWATLPRHPFHTAQKLNFKKIYILLLPPKTNLISVKERFAKAK